MRRSVFSILTTLSVLLCSTAWALSSITDFQKEAQNNPQGPLLVIVTQDGCEWCEYVIERHLDPMQRHQGNTATSSNSKPVFRKLDLMDDVIDFSGQSIDAASFVHRYAQSITPTILLFGPTGQLLTDPLVGVSSRDYYSVYLERTIDKASKHLAETVNKEAGS